MGFPLSFEALPSSPTSPSLYPPTVAQNKASTVGPPVGRPQLLPLPLSTYPPTSTRAQQHIKAMIPRAQARSKTYVPSYRVRGPVRDGRRRFRLSELGVVKKRKKKVYL